MKPETIAKRVRTKRLEIQTIINYHYNKLIELQDKCIHYNLRYRHDGSSGGYDYKDSYWSDWYCPDCKKRWTTDQEYGTEQEMLKKYPTAKKIDKYNSQKDYENFFYD